MPWSLPGIAGINGPNNWRSFDFDDVTDYTPVADSLAVLGLPKAYPWLVKSGNGWHIWVLCSEPVGVLGERKNKFVGYPLDIENKPFDHVELRLNLHITVLPPTPHHSGKLYQFQNGLPVDLPATVTAKAIEAAFLAVATLQKPGEHPQQQPQKNTTTPAQLTIRNPQAHAKKGVDNELETLRNALEGNRNNQLNESAMSIAQLIEIDGISESQAIEIWEEVRFVARSIGLEEKELESTIASAQDGAARHPRAERAVVEEQVIHFKRASEIEPETVAWLWDGRVPVGKYTMLVSDPDMGKSVVTTDVIARVTTGRRLPTDIKIIYSGMHNDIPIKAGAILINPEEGESDTIVPRLIAAGADLEQVIILNTITIQDKRGNASERSITLPEDTAIVARAIDDVHAAIIVIDPITSVFSKKTDSYKEPEVRRALTPLIRVAHEKHCAIIGIMHTNKAGNSNPLYRSLGSVAFGAVARGALFVVTDPDDPDARVLVNHKNNLRVKKSLPLRFTIKENEQKLPYVEWLGASNHTNEVLLNPTRVKSEKSQDILTVLKSSDKAMTVKEIAEALGISDDERNALQKQLNRMVTSSSICKPARNSYTYKDNPYYGEKGYQ